MLTFDATQQSILSSDSLTVSWLFHVTTTGAVDYYWSTQARSWDGDDYSFMVDPDTFDGVSLRRPRAEEGIVAPNRLTFDVFNAGHTLTPGDFDGADVLVMLVLSDGTDEELFCQWLFTAKTEPVSIYQRITFECVDFLQKYLRGSWPATPYVQDLWPSNDARINDRVCVPVPFGTAYVPLRSIYAGDSISLTASTISFVASADGARCKIQDSGDGLGGFEVGRDITVTGATNGANNDTFEVETVAAGEIELAITAGLVTEAAGASVTLSQGSRYYVLGPTAGGKTYTINKVRSPREWGRKSEWASGSYTFTQSTLTDGDGTDWRVFQPIIADADNDGTPDACGLWRAGQPFLDMPVKFSRSDTASLTNPADVIEWVLEDMGVPSAKLDTGAGSSFETAGTTFSGWGLTFNGAFWYRWPDRAKVLAALLAMCHATLDITDKVELRVLSKTSRKTFTDADVLRTSLDGPGTFRYRSLDEDVSDCGYVAWQQDDEPQDQFLQTLVAPAGTKDEPSGQLLEVPLVQDSQDVQRIALLHFERHLNAVAEIDFTDKAVNLALQPADVATIDEANYGGTYAVMIDAMRIRRNLDIDFELTRFGLALNDWGDLSPSAVTVAEDDSHQVWEPVVGGPISDQDVGAVAYEVWGMPHLTVGPTSNYGQFTTIQAAVNALPPGGGQVLILEGAYTVASPINLPPGKDVFIRGVAAGAVTITFGSSLFRLKNCTGTYEFAQFSPVSNNSSPNWGAVLSISGDTAAESTATVLASGIHADLNTLFVGSGGDYLLSNTTSNAKITVERCKTLSGGIVVNNGTGASGARLYVRGCEFDQPAYAAVYSNAPIGEIDGNVIIEPRYHGVWTAAPLLRGNRVFGGSVYIPAGFLLYANGANAQFDGNVIDVVDDGVGSSVGALYGIYAASSGSGRIEATGNRIRLDVSANVLVGLRADDFANGVIGQNPQIDVTNSDAGDPAYGIYVDSDGLDVADNSIADVTADGSEYAILLASGTTGNRVSDNTLPSGAIIRDLGAGNLIGD